MFKQCKPLCVRKYALITLLLCFFGTNSIAQQSQYIFGHLTTENGLMSNAVRSLCEDSRGYIWIGSVNGLQRYDGSRFINYTADLNNEEALHFSVVNIIFEDSKRRFWVAANELYQLNRSTGKFYNYNLHASAGTPIVDGVQKILEDNEGSIWILNRNGVYKLNEQTNQFTDCSAMVGLDPGDYPSLIDKDDRGNIWFVTHQGIKCYNTRFKKVCSRNNNPEKLKIFDDMRPVSSLMANNGNIWIGYTLSRVLYQYNVYANTITAHPIKQIAGIKSEAANFNSKVEEIGITYNKEISMVLPGEGIAFYDPANDSLEEIAIDNNDPNGLHSNREAFIGIVFFKDRQANTWIGTDKGLNIFDPQKKHFNFYGSSNTENKKNLPAYPVSGFVQDPVTQDIYVAYYFGSGGIVKLNKDLQFEAAYKWKQNGKPTVLENQIWSLYMDENGVIWAPNQARSILKLNTHTDKLILENDTAWNFNISCFEKDSNDDLWMGAWAKGLKKFDKKSNTITSYTEPPSGSPLSPKTIFCLYFEGDSIIWAGSNESGLFRFNKRTGKYTNCYFFDGKDSKSVSNNVIKQIIYYSTDTLLLATNMGLNFFDIKKRTFSHLSAKDGLPGDIVESIETDDAKNIWAACNGGLCKINMHPFSVTRYGLADGITDDVFNNAPFLKTLDGKFLVSASKGFVSFSPGNIESAGAAVTPVITGFKLFDKNIPIDSLLESKEPVSLSYKENSITIEFASLQYNVANRLKYYYKLDGVDDDWVTATNEQAAHYNHLQSGKYTFRVKCISRNGQASATETVLNIIIHPPFYKTWWFIGIVALLIAATFYMALSWLKKRRKEKEKLSIEYEKRIAAMEMNTLRAQMNPHFIFNSLNSINTFILENDQENATAYLQKFSSLVRLILDNSRSEWILLDNELKALRLYIDLESLRFENVFSYTISISPGVHSSSVWVPPLIIQPYVENAIRHGLIHRADENGRLEINVWQEKGQLLIEVKDNGIGREASAKMKSKINKLHQPSYGMKITAERLKVLNEVYNVNATVNVTDLVNGNGECTGTKILLTIQYKTNAGNNN